jgi:hypothetical protein
MSQFIQTKRCIQIKQKIMTSPLKEDSKRSRYPQIKQEQITKPTNENGKINQITQML